MNHTMTSATQLPALEQVPPAADLRKMIDEYPLPAIAAGTLESESMGGDEAVKQSLIILDKLNAALAADDAGAVEACFYDTHAWWKDSLALTYHLRTFNTPRTVSKALLETGKLRGLGKFQLDGGAVFIPATPFLQFIDCGLTVRTSSPAATCTGKLVLLPVKNGGEELQWKIWVLSTRLESLDLQPEDESLLKSPRKHLDGAETLETDVLIIGAGNAGVSLAARLKALGVESIIAEKNAQVGDNWALRYDSMRFHIPTSFCELPFMNYGEELQTPHLLTKVDLAEQVKRYVGAFDLNVVNSAKIQSTLYDPSSKRWKVALQTPAGLRSVVSKHLVLATGVGSQKPHLPQIKNEGLYKGVSIHSAGFKNAKELKEKEVKVKAPHQIRSVIVIGSANTAFDVLEDCHAEGLKTTMNVRSPTYIVPVEYVCDKRSLGAYDFGIAAADRLFLMLPTVIDSALAKGLFTMMASEESDRYEALAKAGFPVLDSGDKNCALMSNLIEHAGGHYIDVGGTKLIAEKQVGIKAGVEPVAFTETGLQFSDGSHLDADAVVWCTGFCDRNVSQVAGEILGSNNADGAAVDDGLIRGQDIAARMDTTWGVDNEGEIRGMWKRHSRLDGINFWVMGGYTQQHRFHSRTLALQIKAELEGILPPAYRKTPAVDGKA